MEQEKEDKKTQNDVEQKEEHKHHEEHHEHKHEIKEHHEKKSKFNSDFLIVCLILLLGVILIVNVVITANLNSKLKASVETAKELAKPAKIELTVIKNKKCTDCFDASEVLRAVKDSNVEITKQKDADLSSSEAKELISKYKIKKVPAVIIIGEISKVSLEGFDKKDDALVFSAPNPPFTDSSTGEIKGRVKALEIVDSSCKKCFDVKSLVDQLKGAGISISEEKTLEANSEEAKAMLSKYKIDFAPVLILSKDASSYEFINQVWPQVGTKENDGSYVMRLVNPPYVNLTTNEVKGLVDAVYLTDNSCTSCYDVKIHKTIIANPRGLNVVLNSEKTADISDGEGRQLLSKYNITLVPTIILSKEISAYPSIASLARFFSVKSDGAYVFTGVTSMGTYKDLEKGKVIEAKKQQQPEEGQ